MVSSRSSAINQFCFFFTAQLSDATSMTIASEAVALAGPPEEPFPVHHWNWASYLEELGKLMGETHGQWIGLRENLQENTIFDGKIHGFL